MDVEQMRDELAGLMGWKWIDFGLGYWESPDGTETASIDDVVPTTLDGIAALWPEGWTYWVIRRNGPHYHGIAAQDDSGESPSVMVGPFTNRYDAELALTIAVRKAGAR